MKLQTKDLITIGIYSAIYFVCVMVGSMGAVILLPGFGFVCGSIFSALLAGPVYMLLVHKVKKFGAVTIMNSIMGIALFVTGHAPISFIPCLVFGVLADLLLLAGKYKSRLTMLVSYALSAISLIGPALPIWFMSSYFTNLVEKGKSEAYIAKRLAMSSTDIFWKVILITIVVAILSGLLGLKLADKHFKKAGVIK